MAEILRFIFAVDCSSIVATATIRKNLNIDGQNLSLKRKYSVTKYARDGFDAVGNFLVSELLETDKIYL
jgi:uncharacterized protein YxeA